MYASIPLLVYGTSVLVRCAKVHEPYRGAKQERFKIVRGESIKTAERSVGEYFILLFDGHKIRLRSTDGYRRNPVLYANGYARGTSYIICTWGRHSRHLHTKTTSTTISSGARRVVRRAVF